MIPMMNFSLTNGAKASAALALLAVVPALSAGRISRAQPIQEPSASVPVPDRVALFKGISDNQAELRQYAWKMTLTQTAGGRTESTDVYTNAPGADPSAARKITQVETKEAGFANRKQEQDSRKQRDRLRKIVTSYFEGITPQKVETALSKANVAQNIASTYQVTVHDLVQPGDTVIYYVDKATTRPVRALVTTKDGKDPVSIDARFIQPSGDAPRAPMTVTVTLPGSDRQMKIENSDFARPTAASATADSSAPASQAKP
jgi:hypothetical protein